MVDWYLTDGANQVFFSPGASFKRTLSKEDGLIIVSSGRNSTPIAKSVKRSRDLIIVNTTFKDRDAQYDTLFNMVKEETNAANGSFTFVKGSDSFNVAVRRVIGSEESGEGSLRYVEVEMEITRAS
ncbi:hypothetical protein [Methanolobus sp.]|jgi:hypothetical protein|uniref:hypothetical protein n=1 Tax=Methanolobus sp. TaxID=1874737 RepID=UPI0025EED0B6|nr:hypothetical protein [Methanolobus sp.]